MGKFLTTAPHMPHLHPSVLFSNLKNTTSSALFVLDHAIVTHN